MSWSLEYLPCARSNVNIGGGHMDFVSTATDTATHKVLKTNSGTQYPTNNVYTPTPGVGIGNLDERIYYHNSLGIHFRNLVNCTIITSGYIYHTPTIVKGTNELILIANGKDLNIGGFFFNNPNRLFLKKYGGTITGNMYRFEFFGVIPNDVREDIYFFFADPYTDTKITGLSDSTYRRLNSTEFNGMFTPCRNLYDIKLFINFFNNVRHSKTSLPNSLTSQLWKQGVAGFETYYRQKTRDYWIGITNNWTTTSNNLANSINSLQNQSTEKYKAGTLNYSNIKTTLDTFTSVSNEQD